MSNEQPREQARQNPGFETSRVDLRLPLGTGAMAIILLASALGLIFLFYHFVWTSPAGAPAYQYSQPARQTPAPRLLANPKAQLRALRTVNRSALHGYGWVNKDKGVVHIPIERAMHVIATHGFPPRPPVPTRPSNKSAVPLAPTGEPPQPYRTGTANATQGTPP